jgi:5-formyltetrahydrofolate cyclo-ligase
VWRFVATLPVYLEAVSVVGYISAENEPPTDAILEAAESSGRLVYLPRGGVCPTVVRWNRGDPLELGSGGVLQPANDTYALPVAPAVVLVPTVAWAADGTRIGRGAGFYDRLFKALDARIARVGLAYEFQEFQRLPRDAWDEPLHYVITERRVVRCRTPDSTRLEPSRIEKGGLQLE